MTLYYLLQETILEKSRWFASAANPANPANLANPATDFQISHFTET